VSSRNNYGQEPTAEESESLRIMFETAKRLIEAVGAGKVKLEKSAVVNEKLFIYHGPSRYSMIDPEKEDVGIVKDTKGTGFSSGIVSANIIKWTETMEQWLSGH